MQKNHDVNVNILLKYNRWNDLSNMDNIYE
jgi:hypothetical protein